MKIRLHIVDDANIKLVVLVEQRVFVEGDGRCKLKIRNPGALNDSRKNEQRLRGVGKGTCESVLN